MLFWLFLACVIFWFIYTKFNRVRRAADKIPGSPPWPIIGNTPIGADPAESLKWLMELWHKYGRNIFGVWLGSDYVVFLTEPDDVEVILSSTQHITKNKDYDFVAPWLGNGLITSTGNHWRQSRKIITPTFHFKILEQYTEVFNRCSKLMINKLQDKADGSVLDVYQYVSLCALDAVSESAMGIEINAQDNPDSAAVTSIYDICHCIMERSFSTWKRSEFLFRFSNTCTKFQKALNAFASFRDDIIYKRADILRKKNENQSQDKLAEGDEDGDIKKKTAFLDMLLTTIVDGQNLSDKVIRDEVSTFIFAGHDTTTATIAFSLYNLARYPDIQQKAFEEQKDIYGNDKHQPCSREDFINMKYLERFIKENLRLYPSVPLIARAIDEDLNINGNIVPADSSVAVLIYAMNRNPKYFPDPEKFDPDRFLTDGTEKKHPYQYVPFSAGPRNCIGQKFAMLEIKATLSKMLRNYEMLYAGPENDPIVYTDNITLKSQNGIHIKLKPRVY